MSGRRASPVSPGSGSGGRGGRAFGLALFVLSATGCELLNTDGSWARFNREGEALTVVVTVEPASEEAVERALRSTTGAVEVGTAEVYPAAGPVGTEHAVTVAVPEDYWEQVARVTVDVNAGERGVERFELVQDSAELGHWQVDLTSSGAEGEEREDRFTFTLWEEAPWLDDEDDGPAEGDTEES